MKEVDKEISEMKLSLNAYAHIVAKSYLSQVFNKYFNKYIKLLSYVLIRTYLATLKYLSMICCSNYFSQKKC